MYRIGNVGPTMRKLIRYLVSFWMGSRSRIGWYGFCIGLCPWYIDWCSLLFHPFVQRLHLVSANLSVQLANVQWFCYFLFVVNIDFSICLHSCRFTISIKWCSLVSFGFHCVVQISHEHLWSHHAFAWIYSLHSWKQSRQMCTHTQTYALLL